MDLRDRFRGSLLGLATGDALGTTLEFRSPGTFTPITNMVGGGPFRLEPGQWTDDTSMALCLAESLIECRGFDPGDQLSRYFRWCREGHLSSTGRCFDVGNATRQALERFERTREPYCGSTDPQAAGNGSIMRLAPIALFYGRNPHEAIEKAALSSRTTHGTQEAVDACRYLAALLVGALQGEPKDTLMADHYSPVPALWQETPLSPRIAEVAAGAFRRKDPPALRGTGYVVESLEAALWAFHRSTSFRDGALLAVNLGEDADTTGAVYGQIAGAFYGAGAIPEGWRSKLAHWELIESYADQLLVLSGMGAGG